MKVGAGKVLEKRTSHCIDPNHSVLDSAGEHTPPSGLHASGSPTKGTPGTGRRRRRTHRHGEHLDLGRLPVVRRRANRNLPSVWAEGHLERTFGARGGLPSWETLQAGCRVCRSFPRRDVDDCRVVVGTIDRDSRTECRPARTWRSSRWFRLDAPASGARRGRAPRSRRRSARPTASSRRA